MSHQKSHNRACTSYKDNFQVHNRHHTFSTCAKFFQKSNIDYPADTCTYEHVSERKKCQFFERYYVRIKYYPRIKWMTLFSITVLKFSKKSVFLNSSERFQVIKPKNEMLFVKRRWSLYLGLKGKRPPQNILRHCKS